MFTDYRILKYGPTQNIHAPATSTWPVPWNSALTPPRGRAQCRWPLSCDSGRGGGEAGGRVTTTEPNNLDQMLRNNQLFKLGTTTSSVLGTNKAGMSYPPHPIIGVASRRAGAGPSPVSKMTDRNDKLGRPARSTITRHRPNITHHVNHRPEDDLHGSPALQCWGSTATPVRAYLFSHLRPSRSTRSHDECGPQEPA